MNDETMHYIYAMLAANLLQKLISAYCFSFVV